MAGVICGAGEELDVAGTYPMFREVPQSVEFNKLTMRREKC